jgi:tRNA(Ile)-lysidine synthase
MNRLTSNYYNGGATSRKNKMIKSLTNSIVQYYTWEPGEVLVVAVSGGMDSMVLLHALHQLSAQLGIVLQAASFDHQLRGEESAADVLHVRNYCEAWKIPISIGMADVRALAAAERVSVEVAARHARYQFLADVAVRVGARRIAVAHHQSDQAETVLMHILRGSGLRGLQGMKYAAPSPGTPQIELIRPMLDIPRTAIASYATEHELAYRYDSSNRDTAILRNRLRLEAMPYLRNFNPSIEQGLSQLSHLARVDEAFLHQQTQERAIVETETTVPGRFRLKLDVFRNLHSALQYRWIIWALEQLGKHNSVEYGHVLHAARLAVTGRHGSQAEFSGGVHLRVHYNEIVIEVSGAQSDDRMIGGLEPGTVIGLHVPADIPVYAGTLRFRWQPKEMASKPVELFVTEGTALSLRTRQTGDRFRPQGLRGHSQKLKDWFINHKVPQHWRNSIPLLWAGSELAAIFVYPKWYIAHPFLVQDVSEHPLCIEFRGNS